MTQPKNGTVQPRYTGTVVWADLLRYIEVSGIAGCYVNNKVPQSLSHLITLQHAKLLLCPLIH